MDFLKRNRFKMRMITMLVVFSLIPLIVIDYVWYSIASKNLYEQTIDNSQGTLHQIQTNVDNMLNSVAIAAMNTLYDADEIRIIQSYEKIDQDTRQQNETTLMDLLNNIEKNNANVSSVTLVSDTYQLTTADIGIDFEKLQSKDWYQHFLSSGKNYGITSLHTDDYISKTRNEQTFSVLYKIRTERGINPVRGVLIIEIRHSKLSSLAEIVDSELLQTFVFFNDYLMIGYKGTGEVDTLSQDDQDLYNAAVSSAGEGEITYDGKTCILLKREMNQSGWMIVQLIDKETLFASLKQAFYRVNVVILIAILLLIVIALTWLYRVLKPLEEVVIYMNRIAEGDFEVRFQKITNDEIGQIKSGFNRMGEHILLLMKNIEKEEEEKRAILLKTLNNQISPHFLYNTLNIIRWRAIMGGNNTVSEMIIALIHMLEFNGKRKQEFVLVSDELEHVKNYGKVLSYHYEDQIELVFQTDQGMDEYYTPKLMLQPLVENAVFHGILPKGEKGTIVISTSVKDEKIVFQVSDDGNGMDPEYHDPESGKIGGIGMANVNDRLHYYFGEDFTLEIVSVPGKGVTVTYMIPVIQNLPYKKAVLPD